MASVRSCVCVFTGRGRGRERRLRLPAQRKVGATWWTTEIPFQEYLGLTGLFPDGLCFGSCLTKDVIMGC